VKERSLAHRKFTNTLVSGLSGLAALVGLFFLGWILYIIIGHGVEAINWEFFTELPAPPGMEGGGLVNAIVGTLLITVLASLIGIPLGLLAGVYLAEFGGQSRLAESIRFCSNLLMGTPSIIIGVFVYGLIVIPLGDFSAWAGAVALAIIMLPVVARTTEEMLNLVPNSLREAALGLGTPRWKATLQILFRAASSGLITGILLAVARVSGETAPLLFTALNSPFWFESLNEPIGNLTVTIFNYAMSPYADWQAKAWGASLLITLGVLGATLLARTTLWLRRK